MKPIGKYYEEKKLYQSLYGHIYDSLAFLKDYLHKEFCVIKTFCRRWQIKEEDLIKSLFLTTLLHDIGKLTKTFQKNILAGKHTFYMPHPLAGLPILIAFQNHFPKLLEDVDPSYLEIIAILSHHTQAYSGLYSTTDCKPDFETESVNNFIKAAICIYDKLEFGNYFKREFTKIKINCPNRKSDELKNGVNCLKEINGNKIAIKAIFSFIFSLLKISDILASINFIEKVKNENIKEGFVFDELYDPNNQISFSGITNKMGTWHQKSKRPFQEKLYNNPKPFTMLFAPCGRGKTDASLYWATELIEKSEANRIIFALPTQVTCNAMFNTLSSNNYFGKNKVGLYHSRSALELSERKREEHEEIEDHLSFVKDETFKGEIFFYPVTVTTVDHLLYAFIHGYSKADFSLGNIQTSAIIFDEIHYYDDTMLSNLKQLFGILRRMKIPHLLMSGTFPEFLQSEINKAKEYHLEEDNEGLGFKPFEIIKKEGKSIITNDILDKEVGDELIAGYKNGLKQFIILNTIQSAQLTYLQLKERFKNISINKPNMILLHSRFIYSDRRDIEKKILKHAKAEKEIRRNNIPFILVATQVIEVSLDISSHRLFTECAPVDAVGQRGGRLNRGGQNAGENRMILFKTSNAKPYDERLLENSWTAIPKGTVSYLDFKKACDDVYNGRCISLSDFGVFFKECTLFGRSPKEIRWNEDNGKVFKTRKEDYQTIDVYPIHFFYFYGDELFKMNNEVIKVPAWWYWYDKKEKKGLFCEHIFGDKIYLLCKLPYNNKVGLSTLNTAYVNIEQNYPQIL
ncbi:MAG: CRISPR-associated helicase Cas3' [Candidatus Jettenia sp. CY-1]|nr:MAG: CRISPR-associated helicase Cas3' [Candidatus Jettenia sp. CY-1]